MDSLATTPISILPKILHIEPTDACNITCPCCSRELDSEFRPNNTHHLTFEQILDVVPVQTIRQLEKMFMCGNYGEPAAGKHTLDIYRSFRQANPHVVLGMNTNGAIRNTQWWTQLAEQLNQPQDFVVFSIDGLEDTNSIYRVGSNWDKLISNVTAFIQAGGSAHWDMLVYKHNEHQVEQCEQLAKSLGFKWFRAKVSKRALTGTLEHPVTWDIPTTNAGPIKCHAVNEQSLYIDAQGRLSPCCWLGNRLSNFISDINEVAQTWDSTPHPVCARICSSSNNQTVFSGQWQKEIKLC